jgi:XFP N-terminal domain
MNRMYNTRLNPFIIDSAPQFRFSIELVAAAGVRLCFQRQHQTPLTSQPDQPSSALLPEELQKIHAYWRACNYLAVGMIYLQKFSAAEATADIGTYQTPDSSVIGARVQV